MSEATHAATEMRVLSTKMKAASRPGTLNPLVSDHANRVAPSTGQIVRRPAAPFKASAWTRARSPASIELLIITKMFMKAMPCTQRIRTTSTISIVQRSAGEGARATRGSSM